MLKIPKGTHLFMSNVTEKQESLEKSTKKKNPLGSVMFSA
jgi:hypothetical protein